MSDTVIQLSESRFWADEERARALAAEAALAAGKASTGALQAETNRATAAEGALADQIAAKPGTVVTDGLNTRLTAAESAITGKASITSVTAETSRATAAEGALADRITNEKTPEATPEQAASGTDGTGYLTSRRAVAFYNARIVTTYLRSLFADTEVTSAGNLRAAIGAASTVTASPSADGLMSLADKAKLNGIAAGAQVNTITSVAGRTGDIVLGKADVGLANVDNTSDANKPVSTATQTALAAEQAARLAAVTTLNNRDDAEQAARIAGLAGEQAARINADNVINQARYDGDVANAAATATEVTNRTALIRASETGETTFEDPAARVAGYIRSDGVLAFMKAMFDMMEVESGAFASLDAAGLVFGRNTDDILSVGFPDGIDVFRILLNGAIEAAAARIGGALIVDEDDGSVSIGDSEKRDALRVEPTGQTYIADLTVGALHGVTLGGGSDPDRFSDAELDAMNARAMAIAGERRSRKVPASIQRLSRAYLLSTVAGQSLSSAHEAFPPLSITARFGELMLGDSTRPKLYQQGNSTPGNPLRITTGGAGGTDTEAWITFGAAVLKPAVATVVWMETLYSPAQYQTFRSGGFVGESVPFAAAAMTKQAWNAARNLEGDDTSRRFVLINQGFGGTSSAEWQPAPNVNQVSSLYNIYINGITAVRDAVNAASGATGNLAVVDLNILQGEADGGGAMPKATFKANWANMVANARTAVKGITGQTKDFAVFTYGTSGQFVLDAGGMAVQMGWLELAREQRGWYAVAPSYFVPDKGGHLFANGERWLGAFFGKAKSKVLVDGTEWWPLAPTDFSCAIRNKTIVIQMCAPVYPLAWAPVYTGTKVMSGGVNVDPWVTVATQMFDNKGFNVLFNGIKQPNTTIASVTLPRDGLVQIELAVVPPDGATVEVDYCGQQDYAGSGNLCDSDPYETDLTYEVVTGQIAAEQIPELIGKPYDLRNRCFPFRITAIAA